MVWEGGVHPLGVSVLWTALALVPIRAEKPNDQPSGEPGEQDAQNIETSASTTSPQRTSAGAGCPQYAVLIKG